MSASRTGPNDSETLAYDAEGHRIEDGANTSAWDWRGRLVQVNPKTGDNANAASIAGLLLTTEALVCEIPEDKEKGPAMPGGGGMGDMY